MNERSIFLTGREDSEAGTVIMSKNDGLCCITFNYRGNAIEETATDYFEAFCHIRKRLEEISLIPHCYGASLNVYPSGICRDWRKGLLAYRLTLG